MDDADDEIVPLSDLFMLTEPYFFMRFYSTIKFTPSKADTKSHGDDAVEQKNYFHIEYCNKDCVGEDNRNNSHKIHS